jgi:hypothetical protein
MPIGGTHNWAEHIGADPMKRGMHPIPIIGMLQPIMAMLQLAMPVLMGELSAACP